MALISGTDEALFHDSLTELGEEEKFTLRWGKTSWMQHWAMAAGTLAGGFIAAIQPQATFFAAALCYLVAAVANVVLVEPTRVKAARTGSHLDEVRNVFVHSLVRVDALRWLLIYGAIVFSLLQPAVWWYQPYLAAAGWGVQYMGIAFCIIGIVAGVAAKYSSKLRTRLGIRGATIAVMAAISSSFLVLGIFSGAWVGMLILLHQLARGAQGVLISAEIHPRIDSEYRATTVSIFGSAQRLCYSLVLIPCGILVDHFGVAAGFTVHGVVLGIAAVILIRAMPSSLRT
jgi:MFS family permease